jgi:hypothetical protein
MNDAEAPPPIHVVALLRGFATSAFPEAPVDAADLLGYAFEESLIVLGMQSAPAMAGEALASIDIERLRSGVPDRLQKFAGLLVTALVCREAGRMLGCDARSLLRGLQTELAATGDVWG